MKRKQKEEDWGELLKWKYLVAAHQINQERCGVSVLEKI